uniref:Uncharacterized protein n=1 Tax=Meloidogyne enterolobii TaxID=390850 RepID=A0A6V7UEA6_MELEN|nr:unnamed protein product [Meloidogyne enterolobii]
MSTHQKIDRDSGNAITNALSFLETPHTNVSISNSSFIELLTLNPVNITPFHFKIHATTNYIDLAFDTLDTLYFLKNEDLASMPSKFSKFSPAAQKREEI